MAVRLADLAAIVQGELVGDGAVMIDDARPLDCSRAGDVTLLDRCDRKDRLTASAARAAVVPLDMDPAGLEIPVIRVADVHRAFLTIVAHFRPPRTRTRGGVSPAAFVSPAAVLADDVEVMAGASIGDDVTIGRGVTIHPGACIMAGCRLAEGVTIYPNAVLYENTIVGARSLIHAGAVLGCHGFGYRAVDGRYEPTGQLGYVEIGADVEIGANTTIDRGTYGPTFIGEGTKIDNQVMIAHNCRLGRHNMICSQVGIAGSTATGDYVVMAGQVGVRDHVHIGDRAVLGAMAGISNDVPAGATMIGIPATPEREQKIKQAALAKLPEMRKQLKDLQQTVERMIRQQANSSAGPPTGGPLAPDAQAA